MAELKWESNTDRRRSWVFRAGKWSVLATYDPNVFWLKAHDCVLKSCSSVDGAKQLAQAIENLLDPPECPTFAAFGDHWRGTMSERFKHCPDCGALLGGSQ